MRRSNCCVGTLRPSTSNWLTWHGKLSTGAANCSPVATAKQPRTPELGLFRPPQLGLLDLFDVDVLEGDDPHLLDEPRRPVHVPHPGVGQSELEGDLTVGVAWHHLDAVRQVEPPLGLHDVAELADDVLVFAVQRELHLGFVLFEILSTHLPLICSDVLLPANFHGWAPHGPFGPMGPVESPAARIVAG